MICRHLLKAGSYDISSLHNDADHGIGYSVSRFTPPLHKPVPLIGGGHQVNSCSRRNIVQGYGPTGTDHDLVSVNRSGNDTSCCGGDGQIVQRNRWIFPTEEGIDLTVNDIPDVVDIGDAEVDRHYIPWFVQVREGQDALHLCRGLAGSPGAFCRPRYLQVPEGVTHHTIIVPSHQSSHALLPGYNGDRVRVAHITRMILPRQTADMPLTMHTAAGIRRRDSTLVVPSHESSHSPTALDAACRVAGGHSACIIRAHQASNR